MPRGRNLALGFRDLLIQPHKSNSRDCVWTAEIVEQMIKMTADETFAKACVPYKKRQDSIDLVEDMRNCGGCGGLIARRTALRCGVCRCVYYCSKHCHQTYWQVHKKTCKKTTKMERRFHEAGDTGFRVLWSLYAVSLPSAGLGPYYFAINPRCCILNETKPQSHPEHLTILLMTRGDEHEGLALIQISHLDPIKLMAFLKDTLRIWMSRSVVESVEVSHLNDDARYFRNNLIHLHTQVKQGLHEKPYSSTHRRFFVITPFLNKRGLNWSSYNIACGSEEETIFTRFREFFHERD